MALSKTTLNFADRRGYDLCEMSIGGYDTRPESEAVWCFSSENDCEPDFIYLINDDGTFTFYDALHVPSRIQEEMPATLNDEKHLREMVGYLATACGKRPPIN